MNVRRPGPPPAYSARRLPRWAFISDRTGTAAQPTVACSAHSFPRMKPHPEWNPSPSRWTSTARPWSNDGRSRIVFHGGGPGGLWINCFAADSRQRANWRFRLGQPTDALDYNAGACGVARWRASSSPPRPPRNKRVTHNQPSTAALSRRARLAGPKDSPPTLTSRTTRVRRSTPLEHLRAKGFLYVYNHYCRCGPR